MIYFIFHNIYLGNMNIINTVYILFHKIPQGQSSMVNIQMFLIETIFSKTGFKERSITFSYYFNVYCSPK